MLLGGLSGCLVPVALKQTHSLTQPERKENMHCSQQYKIPALVLMPIHESIFLMIKKKRWLKGERTTTGSIFDQIFLSLNGDPV